MGGVAPVTPLLETRGLSKRFGGLEAVGGVDFRLDGGEIRALIRPNGAGKTTLVGLISGRLEATAGAVLFGGRDITAAPGVGACRARHRLHLQGHERLP